MRRVAYLNSLPKFKPLLDCGFLEILQADASVLQADARPETETYREEKEKKEKVAKATKKNSVSLEELSITHIAEWLTKQRSNNRYREYDENRVLEVFKNYCLSKNRQYADYVAALRNAFEWDCFKPKNDTQKAPTKQAKYPTQTEI